MNRILDITFATVVTTLIASPVFAGVAPATPAPIAGLGIGAVALVGFGYRALKGRSTK